MAGSLKITVASRTAAQPHIKTAEKEFGNYTTPKNWTQTRTTNEWINEKNGVNKEYLFIIHKNGKTEAIPEIKVEKIDIRNLATVNQQRLAF